MKTLPAPGAPLKDQMENWNIKKNKVETEVNKFRANKIKRSVFKKGWSVDILTGINPHDTQASIPIRDLIVVFSNRFEFI